MCAKGAGPEGERPPARLAPRLRAVRLLVTDCDGVLTDGGVYYSDRGELLKRFSIRDGMGVERLNTMAGIVTAIVSGERSQALKRRAEKLGIEDCELGVKDKAAAMRALAERRGLLLEACAYIGDDINDLPAIALVGLSACPSDAIQEVRQGVDYVCAHPGGHGAFREFADLILSVSDKAV